MEIIKDNQSEIKNTLFEMKSILSGINRVEEEEDRITDVEVGESSKQLGHWRAKGSGEGIVSRFR